MKSIPVSPDLVKLWDGFAAEAPGGRSDERSGPIYFTNKFYYGIPCNKTNNYDCIICENAKKMNKKVLKFCNIYLRLFVKGPLGHFKPQNCLFCVFYASCSIKYTFIYSEKSFKIHFIAILKEKLARFFSFERLPGASAAKLFSDFVQTKNRPGGIIFLSSDNKDGKDPKRWKEGC